MARRLSLVETEVQEFRLAGSQRRLDEIVEGYDRDPEAATPTWVGGVEEVLLSPAPISCDLPRRGHDPAIEVWGYGCCSLTLFGRQVAAISTTIGVEECESAREWPSVVEALSDVGTVWSARPLGSPAGVAGACWADARPGVSVAPRSLDLRLVTAKRSGDAAAQLAAAADRGDGPRRLDQLPRTPMSWGRALLVNDAGESAACVPAAELEDVVVELDGRSVALRLCVEQRALRRADTADLLIVAFGLLDDDTAAGIEQLLRCALEHGLAHDWLARRAEHLNDRQAECVARLLEEDTTMAQREELQRQLALLRYVFGNELELIWGFDLDGPRGADAICARIDHVTRLTQRWQRELTRFERLADVSTVISSAGFRHPRDTITLAPTIPGLAEERSPLKQVALWWRNRGDDRLPVGTGGGRRRSPSSLQRRRRREHLPAGAREIELHPFRNRYALFEELNASIALTSFMTAASAVFLGVILQRGGDDTLPMDVLFLFISTFGFLFATLIYANASGRLARHGTFGHEEQVEIANRVSEYLGVFPLLVSIPLSVSRFLQSGPIPWAVATLALIAMLAYHYLPGASLLERDISDERVGSDWQRRYLFVPGLATLMAATYLGELVDGGALEVAGAIGFALMSLIIVLLSAMLPERANPQEYLVDDWDMLGDETPSLYMRPSRDALAAEEVGHTH